MDDQKRPPLLFANRVLRRLVDNLCGNNMIATPQDYLTLRTVFRWCHGSWEAVNQGDIVHTRLLATLVMAWGKMPGRHRTTEFG